jgi:chromosome segregation ATPase
MEWLDRHMKDLLAKHGSPREASAGVDFPQGSASPVSNTITAALEVISQAGAAVKDKEDRAAIVLARAEELSNAAIEKLKSVEARAAFAERARQKAEADAAEHTNEAARLRAQLEEAQSQLVANEAELSIAQRRANEAEWRAKIAERRANEAEADIERIVEAVRTQILARPATTETKKAETAA